MLLEQIARYRPFSSLPSIATAIASVCVATSTFAHHGPPVAPLYVMEPLQEIEGEVVEIFWRNPHVRFRVEDEDGQIWELESDPVGWLARNGIGPDLLAVGDRVRAIGRVSTRRANEIALMNLLLPNGEEFTGTAGNRELRFADERVQLVRERISEEDAARAQEAANGIFRVWARGVREFGGHAEPDNDEILLTPPAGAARADFNALTDEPILECVPDGMPRAMLHPTPIEFIDDGDRISLRIHEHDIERTIFMTEGVEPQTSPLGHSVGRWDGDALVVTTTRVNWPYSDEAGTPQSGAVELIERFTMSDDETRLDYELTSVDPAVFLSPSVRTASWVWVPGLEIEPFECSLWEGTED